MTAKAIMVLATTSGAAEKMSLFHTPHHLRREAALGKREDFEKFLRLVSDVPARAGDAPSSNTNS